MTTFTEMRKFASVNGFSAELVKELIGDYCVRGKAIDLGTVDPFKLLKRNTWILNRGGRLLDVAGKVNPDATSLRLDRDADNILHVRIVDADLNTLYTIDLGEKGKTTKDEFEYIVRDGKGKVVVRDHKWKGVTTFFAPEEEVVVKKAAAPKKTKAAPKKAKAEKRVKAVKNPVPAAAPETDPVAEAETLDEDVPPAELG